MNAFSLFEIPLIFLFFCSLISSFRQKSNIVKVASNDGDHVRTIYIGKSARFAAYLVHYEIDQVPQEPPPLVQTNESRVPDSCRITMERVSVVEGERRLTQLDINTHICTWIMMMIMLTTTPFPVISNETYLAPIWITQFNG